MKISQITKQIIHVKFETQEELTKTFLRFQEHYESPNPEFRGKVFTLGQYRNWYAQEYGAFTYYTDWDGMNIPSYILQQFYDGQFDPLSPQEQTLLDAFRSRTDLFYIIGTHGEEDALEHEICHGLYYLDFRYWNEINEVLEELPLKKLKDWLITKGYTEEVLMDECQAFIIADSDWLNEKHNIVIPDIFQTKLKNIKERYFKKS